MFIAGIDYSISSPAVVKAELDDDFNIINIDYLSFSSVQKVCKSDSRIIHHDKKNFANDIERFHYLTFYVEHMLYGKDEAEYVAIEGYAMGGMGKVFNIAEATFNTKSMIYNHGTNIRIYTPSAIKKFATGNGTAGKFSMFEHFQKEGQSLLDLSRLPELKNPQEDIIDAYWIMRMLQTELKLRNGIITLRELNSKQIEVFNAVSKSQPENILVRPFIGGAKKDTVSS